LLFAGQADSLGWTMRWWRRLRRRTDQGHEPRSRAGPAGSLFRLASDTQARRLDESRAAYFAETSSSAATAEARALRLRVAGISMPRMAARRVGISRRSTTMSTMPRSRRNSERWKP